VSDKGYKRRGLVPSARGRLYDAYVDGVSLEDITDRFGLANQSSVVNVAKAVAKERGVPFKLRTKPRF
jgi:hypothetical protein